MTKEIRRLPQAPRTPRHPIKPEYRTAARGTRYFFRHDTCTAPQVQPSSANKIPPANTSADSSKTPSRLADYFLVPTSFFPRRVDSSRPSNPPRLPSPTSLLPAASSLRRLCKFIRSVQVNFSVRVSLVRGWIFCFSCLSNLVWFSPTAERIGGFSFVFCSIHRFTDWLGWMGISVSVCACGHGGGMGLQ
jgi:hypothetical protein